MAGLVFQVASIPNKSYLKTNKALSHQAKIQPQTSILSNRPPTHIFR